MLLHSIFRHLYNDLPDMLLTGEVRVRLLGLLEGKHLVDYRLDLARGDEPIHILEPTHASATSGYYGAREVHTACESQ